MNPATPCSRLERIQRQRRYKLIRFALLFFLIGVVCGRAFKKETIIEVDRVVNAQLISAEVEVDKVEAAEALIEAKKNMPNFVQGKASYYHTGGCLGCDENMIMANGEKLDDTKLTLALTPQIVRAFKILNKEVTVANIENGKTVRARVTDTGGFGKYNRVADLSKATKEAINCASLCEVKVIFE